MKNLNWRSISTSFESLIPDLVSFFGNHFNFLSYWHMYFLNIFNVKSNNIDKITHTCEKNVIIEANTGYRVIYYFY